MLIEHMKLRPMSGSFDAARIEQHLGSLAHVLPSPVAAHEYIIEQSEEEAAYAVRYYNESGRHSWTCTIVQVGPDLVDIVSDYSRPVARKVKRFVQWMMDSFPCRIENDRHADVTA